MEFSFWGNYMEFVAERFRRKVVALVYAGSNPVKLPRRSVHLIGQDYRFSICPHEFDPRTDYIINWIWCLMVASELWEFVE